MLLHTKAIVDYITLYLHGLLTTQLPCFASV